MHIIEYQVMYTSFVYHNEGVNNPGRGQLVFRTSSAREAGNDKDDDCDNDNVVYNKCLWLSRAFAMEQMFKCGL